MTCKKCSEQIGLPATWGPHARLERPNTVRTSGYVATGNQKLYACTACDTVLRKGNNTGWALATRAVAVPRPAVTGVPN
ncbi:MAG TPA: hypothetical protein VLI06_05690 [Solimonas sp.]|nr:hypothetical protein [Solimonas sp.]